MFTEWIAGMLLRPGATFLRAREELRFGYWWIVLSVMVLDTVATIFSSPDRAELIANLDLTIMTCVGFLLIAFDLQALFVMGAGRLVGWPVSWADALKYTGLLWAFLFLDEIITFYPALKNYEAYSTAGSALVLVWYAVSVTIGIRRLTGVSVWRGLLFTFVSAWPWPLAFMILHIVALLQQ